MQNKTYEFSYESVFGTDICTYVNLKRSMGLWFKTPASNLRRFDRLCLQLKIKEPILTEELITHWISPIEGESPNTRLARITALKGFAEYLSANGIPVKWPVVHQSYHRQASFTPYIFTKSEISCIFAASDSQKESSNGSQFHLIFPTILRVLYGTGLRISEALSLKCSDVDLESGHLTVWNSKFDNSRCIPVSNSLRQVLSIYDKTILRPIGSDYFFPNSKGEPYSQRTVYDKFRVVLWQCGISHGGSRKGPRVHDFRHTFAVHSLQKCESAGLDTYTFLPILAAYLGHKKVSTTEKYLRLTAEAFPSFLEKAIVLSDTAIPEVTDYE